MTITVTNSSATQKRMTLSVWQNGNPAKAGAPTSKPVVKIMYACLVPAPHIGIRKDSFKMVGDMLVRPYNYRGKR